MQCLKKWVFLFIAYESWLRTKMLFITHRHKICNIFCISSKDTHKKTPHEKKSNGSLRSFLFSKYQQKPVQYFAMCYLLQKYPSSPPCIPRATNLDN